MTAIGVDVVGTTPAAYAKIISDDYAKWGKVVAGRRHQAGVKEHYLISAPICSTIGFGVA